MPGHEMDQDRYDDDGHDADVLEAVGVTADCIESAEHKDAQAPQPTDKLSIFLLSNFLK